ncbi:MAG: hypothetical protein K6F79_08145 [Saccharofermentans sp.]|nr:hypothetical protein [Saccharofermentans sp.]
MNYQDQNAELERRIREAERNLDIPRMTKKDYIVAMVFAGVCLVAVILGGILL